MSTRRQQCRKCTPFLVDEGVSLSVGEQCDERRGEAARREDDAVVGRGDGVMWEAHRPHHVSLHVLFSRRTAAPLHSRAVHRFTLRVVVAELARAPRDRNLSRS